MSASLVDQVLAKVSSSPFSGAAVSLGQPCERDEECEAADADSVCSEGGVCACAAFDGEEDDDRGIASSRPFGLLRSWIMRRRRRPRSTSSNGWFCQRRRLRLCPEGTFQVRPPIRKELII